MNFLLEKQTRRYIVFLLIIGLLFIVMLCICNMNTLPLFVSVAAGVLMAGFLMGGTYFYFRRREQIYEDASRIVEKFAEGDFTSHLEGNQEGTIYHLYSAIDELAMSLKSKEEAEHQTKVFLKDTISDISHQMKTPLSALHMYNEIMTEEADHPETIRTFSAKSETALNRMDRLIQLLLKVMRLDAGSITFAKELCKVDEIIEKAIEDLRMRAESEHKQLVLEGDSEQYIDCDPVWTCEAISNLVKNGLDHTDENGLVNITWSETPAMLHIIVRDNGSGISPEDLHHIFKRFYRGQNAGNQPGIGLGLSLAKAIIEGQDGSLAVQSVEGEGTVFTVSFKKAYAV